MCPNRPRTLLAVAALVSLLGAACSEIEDGIDVGPEDGAQTEPQDGAPEGEPGTPAGPALSDDGPVGENAEGYLRGDVPALVIEIASAPGREPAAGAVGHLRSVAARELDKPGGIEVRSHTIDTERGSYSRGDLEALESEHRQSRSGPETASIFVLSLDGEFAGGSGSLGVAWKASAFAVFGDQIETASGPLVSPSRIESAVLVHELGHLLGLVNIGFTSPREREDPENPSHSESRDSVMYWAVESDVVTTVLEGPPPQDFDDDDRADLDDRRAGRL